jgi:hypothetical protein
VGRTKQRKVGLPGHSSNVMNEQTTGDQNVDNNIADYGDLNYEEADTSDKIESSPVEGYNNFKKTHATEKSMSDTI